MKNNIILASIIVISTLASSRSMAASCDPVQLDSEAETAQIALRAKMKAAMAQNESAAVDMSEYLEKVDALRACQRAIDPKKVDRCTDYSMWASRTLTNQFSMDRYFEVIQSKRGLCIQNSLSYQYVLRNSRQVQILFHLNGYYTMNHVVPAKTAGGIPTGRTFLFADGRMAGTSYAYIIDFPEPLESYDISLFWGATVAIGNSTEKLERILNGDQLTFKWANGAYVTIDGLSEQIIASNFMTPASYTGTVLTDEDVDPNGRRRLFPRIEIPQNSQFANQPVLTHY